MRAGMPRGPWVAVAVCCALLLLGSCATVQGRDPPGGQPAAAARANPPARELTVESLAMATRRKSEGASPGAAVLRTALRMMEERIIVKGGCWDWVNRAFDDAGLPSSKRITVFKGTEKGPYADPTLIKPGDWLYIVNFTFGNIGHSTIFIDWIEFEARSAITLEYIGQNREMPGRFREYDITKCYMVLRGKE
jgi:hypothetical protein